MPWRILFLGSGIRFLFLHRPRSVHKCLGNSCGEVTPAKAAKNPGPLDFLGPMEIFSKEAVPELQEMAVYRFRPVGGVV